MNRARRCSSLAIAALLVSPALAVDVERNPKANPNGLHMVLGRIHAHAKSNEWQAENWSDPVIEKWLENAAVLLSEAAGKEAGKLPVKFADVRPVAAAGGGRFLRGGHLIVGRDVEVNHASKSIIFADGNAEIGFAESCIIVARGVVSIAHCNNSVVVSGTFIEISHDGNIPRDVAGGSTVLCRGRTDISHCAGTLVLAQEGATVSHARGTTFFGLEPKTSSRDPACKVVKTPPDFLLEPRAEDPLEKKIEALGSVRPKGLVFRFDGKRYAADVGQAIVDESGAPVEALADWRVTFVGHEAAAFSNGEVDVPFLLPK
jgi:hypothetical protein